MSIEILAPAGNVGMLRAAVYAGADAVYLGLWAYSARKSADNFSYEELVSAVQFCHARNVKVYVALNTLVYPRELKEIADIIAKAGLANVDALIIQDLSIVRMARVIAPSLALHASTQLSVHSLQGALALEALGFSRVILARELNITEIEYISSHCALQTEVFVHGALCMSVSGQCYMSSFLGGRSGNRGACAGPCRLPFAADEGEGHHLSLKDMSHLDSIKELERIGVASAKIEGRMRTEEYVAAAVDSACKALNGEEYDAQLLQDVFSRSGFTHGYISGNIDKNMFGVRTPDDTAAAKAAAPRLRELYRRERMNVPINMHFTLTNTTAKLTVTDARRSCTATAEHGGEAAKQDQREAIRRALAKTGGTPFYAKDITLVLECDYYIASGIVSELRKTALSELLAVRESTPNVAISSYEPPALVRRELRCARLIARFADLAQCPANISDFALVILPLAQYKNMQALPLNKICLELPRLECGDIEPAVQKMVDEAKGMGFAGFTAENIAHTRIVSGSDNIIGGFGLNIANPLCAEEYQSMGLSVITSSVENTLEDMAYIPTDLPLAAICYGHMPLMLTRACPLHNVRECAGCDKKGVLRDRKNAKMPVRCKGGARTIYNPVPLYMGDRLGEMPIDYAVLYFSIEPKARVAEVIRLFASHSVYDGEFTRGLYYKGTV